MNKLAEAKSIYKIYGKEALTYNQMLSIILGKEIDLTIEEFKEFRNMTKKEFMEIGLSETQSQKLCAINDLNEKLDIYGNKYREKISSPNDAIKVLGEKLKYEKKENFIAIYLNTKLEVIKKEVVSVGSIDSSIVHPREVFKMAIKLSASSIMLAHNHPSGNSTPSINDKNITKRLVEAGELLGIRIIDHIIVAGNDYYSFKENELI